MLPVHANWTPPPRQSIVKLAKRALDKLPGITHVHKVKKGDTLWKISNMYNVPIKAIRKWNKRTIRRNILRVGAEIVLKLPATYPSST